MENKISEFVPRLIHCFGTEANKIDINTVIRMVESSKNNIIPINTHNIDEIDNWEDLPIGYGDANWKKFSEKVNENEYIPVWNINLQTSAEEVIRRTLKAVELGGKKAVKLEVLDYTLTVSQNSEVVKATEILVKNYGLEVWPLIIPDKATIDELLKIGCSMIRLIGSPIGSGLGISEECISMLKYIKSQNMNVKVMLDGGVGSKKDVYKALINGFDSVLVNSYLYKLPYTPEEELSNIVDIK